jgi:peptidoglycan/LPS O-acetylase OafA/YrhL
MQHTLKPLPTEENNKLLGLEALRFVTAFVILVYHYRHFSSVAGKLVDRVPERLPLYSLLQPFHDYGVLGVWVFWCISGFIFFWKYRDAIAEGAVGGWKFFVLRFSRLYPLHFVTLLIVALLQSFYFNLHGYFFVFQNNDLPHFLAQLFMASQWSIVQGLTFNGPIWSVSVEVLVYLLFFLMLLVTRSWLLNVVIVLACLIAPSLNASGQVTICLAFFYIGGLAAIARQTVTASRFKAAVEAGAWLVVLIVPPLVMSFGRDRFDRFDSQLLLAYTPFLLFCLSREIAAPTVVQRAVQAAGNMTYSSYLVHFPIQLVIVLCFAIAGRPVPIYDGALFAAYLFATLLLSYFTFRYFEAPAQSLIRSALLRAEPAQGALRRASSA